MADSSLGDVTEIVMGQSPPGEKCNTDSIGLPLLNGPTEYGPHHPSPLQYTTDARKRARPGDILFCVRGSTTGRMNWADRDYAIGRGVAAIRHRKHMELQPFVRAVIDYELPDLLAQATGSTFPNISADQLAHVPWPPLPLEEQGAIACILGTLENKIELNHRISRTLEAMAQAIFKSWFVDFDPVVAKADGRKPYGMDDETAALFPDGFIVSDLGTIPKGWSIGRIGNIGENTRKGVKPSEISKDTPYIGLEHMPRCSICLGEWGSAGDVSSGKFAFRKNDILFGKLRPYFHKVGVAPLDGVCSTDVLVVRPRESGWMGLLLGHLSSVEFINYVDGASGGTKMPRTSWDDMARYEIAVPTPEIGSAYTHFVSNLVSMMNEHVFESLALASLRDALLPKLLSGEIRLTDADRAVSEVV